MKAAQIVGQQFGQLTVLTEYRNEKGASVCTCRCACGNTSTVYKCNLTAGRTKSCGCLEAAAQRKYRDLSGKRFGRLSAMEPTAARTGGRVVWRCICDCGTEVLVSAQNLIRGDTKSCGCLRLEKQDVAGRRFGKLLALSPDRASPGGPRKWICRCDCGNLCSVAISNLKNGHTQSCGCLAEQEKRIMIGDTCLDVIASHTLPKNNRSGIKGVSYYSRTDSWVATLTFRGTRYYLGKYKTIPEAAAARSAAEDALVKPFLKKYAHLLSEKRKRTGAHGSPLPDAQKL